MKLKTENIKKVKEHLKGYTPKGDIKDFPIEVIEWMCYNQVKQGNEVNVKVFERMPYASYIYGGFDWPDNICSPIILDKKFYIFFKNYPNGLQIEEIEEPMRYFYVTYKAESGEGYFCYQSVNYPSFNELSKHAISNHDLKETEMVMPTYIHEFKSKEDYENFIK